MNTSNFTKMNNPQFERRVAFARALLILLLLFAALFVHAQTSRFDYVGGEQSYVVPAGINKVEIVTFGAQGGTGGLSALGGKGGYAKGFLDVSPGQTLYIYSGGMGASISTTTLSGGGFNGGGNSRSTTGNPVGAGGGASDVRVGGNSLTHRVIVAGGGGGSCSPSYTGGAGGDMIGDNGMSPENTAGPGGSQVAGGISLTGCESGQFGIGGNSSLFAQCAGGGGGWYGGASSCGAGGGSGYIGGVTDAYTIGGIREGHGVVFITPIAAAANDNCSTAQPIQCGDVIMGNTAGTGADNPPLCTTPNGSAGGVWYSFVGTGDQVTFSTCNPGTNFDTKISAYIGTCDELICVAGNDNYPGCNGGSQLDITTINGAFYFILINSNQDEGDFELTVTCPKSNDTCAEACPITCGMSVMGELAATGITGPGCVEADYALWYTFTGTNECTKISACNLNNNNNLRITLFTGSCNGLMCAGSYPITAICGLPDVGAFVANLGQQYYVQVSTDDGIAAEFLLEMSCTPVDPFQAQCPADLNLPCDAGIPEAASNLMSFMELGGSVSGGTCGTMIYSGYNVMAEDVISGNTCDGITINRTYSIQNLQFNMVATCTQVINIAGSPTPTITCAPNTFVNCFDDIQPGLYNPNIQFTCPQGIQLLTSDVNLISGSSNCPGAVYRVEFTITDDCGRVASCTQTFTITNSSPVIICAVDAIVTCLADINPSTNDVDYSASCQLGTSVTFSVPQLVSGTANCPGAVYEVTYTVLDECGNSAACTRSFTIENDPPFINCPAGATVSCVDEINVSIADAEISTSCGLGSTVTLIGPTLISGTANCPGAEYEVVYTITDACGRTANCQRIFTIQNAGPTISCPAGGIVECVEDISLDPNQAVVITSCNVNSNVQVVGPTLMSGQAACSGTVYEVEYTVTDQCGRTASCTSTYTLANEGPVILECAPDRIVECPDDILPEPENLVVATSCGLDASITPGEVKQVAGDGLCNASAYEITYLVMDECGRTTQCTQRFTIENEAPRVYAPEALFISCLEELETLVFNNCYYETSCGIPVAEVEVIGPIYNEDKPLCNGSVINYIYSVTDACGRNTTIAGATIFRVNSTTLEDEFPDLELACEELPEAADSNSICGFMELDYKEEMITLPDGSIEVSRMYTALDSCENEFTHLQLITLDCSENNTHSVKGGGERPGMDNLVPKLSTTISAFKMYPNPTTDFINIQVEQEDANIQLQVYDNLGKMVYQSPGSKEMIYRLEVANWSAGLYHLLVLSDGEILKTEQFVKQE